MKRIRWSSAVALALVLSSLAPAAAADAPRYRPDSNADRSAVPDGAKWQLAPLFADEAAFAAALRQAAADRAKLAGFRGKLADPAALRDGLELYFRCRLQAKKLTMYAGLRQATDQRSSAVGAMNDQAQGELAAFMADAAFLRTEVLAMSDAAFAAALAKEPRLGEYKAYLSELRRRRSRVLSDEGERLLGLAGDHLWAEIDLNEIPSPFEKAYRAARADIPLPEITDEKGAKVRLTYSNYSRYRASSDRRVRRDAVAALFGNLATHRDLYAATLAGEIGFHVFLARARGYDTALDAYMDKDNIPPAVYRALVDAVRANLAPLHRYVALRKTALGLPDVHIYDLYPPLVASADRTIPYDEAVSTIRAALAPLGKEYGKVLAQGLDLSSGWIDLYPHKDKESGAFAGFAYGVHPYVKMNFQESFDDVSTLAHEMGHALQQHLSMTTQPYPTSEFSLTLSEIPSTVNEKLLSDHMLAKATSDDERLWLLAELVESLRTTIWRQALFAEFELAIATAIEKGTPVTADFLDSTYRGLLRAYYGPDFVIDENDPVEWASVPHFYYKFYTYAYAMGLSSGVALAEKVQSGDPAARDAYLAFLSAGNSRPPADLLRAAGVDLTKPDAVNAAAKLMDRSIAEMERLLAKRKK